MNCRKAKKTRFFYDRPLSFSTPKFTSVPSPIVRALKFLDLEIFTTSMLSRGVFLRPALRTSLRTKATKSSAKREFIPIQLLKDVPNVGVAGEILKVKPGYMRNFLHHDNKACYLTATQGPRIPVVESAPKEMLKKKKKSKKITDEILPEADQNATESAPEYTAMSLEELSNMFSSMRKNSKGPTITVDPNLQATGSTASFTLVELEENIPATFNYKSNKFPITNDALSLAIFESTGIEVPATAIQVRTTAGANLAEITEAGVYTWVFKSQEDSKTLKKNLRIQ